MGFKRLRCPVCGHRVSFWWNFFSLANAEHSCSYCKSRLGWYPMIWLYSFLCGLLMIAIFIGLSNMSEFPFISLILAFFLAQIIFMLTPKRIKLIFDNRDGAV
jgi:maltodextrin utilization protein YvdJ